MPLTSEALGVRLIQDLRSSGVPVLAETPPRDRPMLLDVGDSVGSSRVRVFLWNITGGGRSRSANEYRVQTTRPHSQPLLIPGIPTVLLGYHAELSVYAAWDVAQHPNPGASSSLQVPREILDLAATNGIAEHHRAIRGTVSEDTVVAVRAQLVRSVIEAAVAHDSMTAIAGPFAADGDVTRALPTIVLDDIPRSYRDVRVRARDAAFRRSVLRAYGCTCAFCGLTLDIVEAAHIRPVAFGGTDHPSNGIAACPTHHRSFDAGILRLGDSGEITVDDQTFAAAGGADSDLQAFRRALNSRLEVPVDTIALPNPENIAFRKTMFEDVA